jgi:hypothetical protein
LGEKANSYEALIERAFGTEPTRTSRLRKRRSSWARQRQQPQWRQLENGFDGCGEIEIAVPRDRAGTFEPLLIPKGQTRFEGFDDRIFSLYAPGMTVQKIQGNLTELYGIDVLPDLISRVTNSVLDEVREWQGRRLDPVYPIVFFDALREKIRDSNVVVHGMKAEPGCCTRESDRWMITRRRSRFLSLTLAMKRDQTESWAQICPSSARQQLDLIDRNRRYCHWLTEVWSRPRTTIFPVTICVGQKTDVKPIATATFWVPFVV